MSWSIFEDLTNNNEGKSKFCFCWCTHTYEEHLAIGPPIEALYVIGGEIGGECIRGMPCSYFMCPCEAFRAYDKNKNEISNSEVAAKMT